MEGKRPDSRLFSSPLVLQETKVDLPKLEKLRPGPLSAADKDFERRAAATAYRVQPADEVETAYRHGRWWNDRERVRQALIAGNVPVARVERFMACGSNCIIEYSPSLQKHRVRASYCKDRFCVPCSRARSKKISEQLIKRCEGSTVRFMTLTLRASSKPLNFVLSRLLSSFRKLRQQKLWRKCVAGGAAVVEITRGKNGSHWHVHLHALTVGTWINDDLLASGWKKATGDSSIIDVRLVRDPAKAVGYLAGYATKGWTQQVLSNPDWLLECILSLRGRRLLIPFGSWFGVDEVLRQVECDDWKRVGRLSVVFADAVAGQPYAVAVFRSLFTAAGVVSGRPVFTGIDPPWSGP